jgi:preprotein translocase subunit SecA
MSLLVESCQIADGAMDYTKQLKRKRNYRFVKNRNSSSNYISEFFLLYPKLSGMTGTGKTAEVEFEKILSVEEIPTARPNQRKDLSDLIYRINSQNGTQLLNHVMRFLLLEPILIRTTTVEKSEMLAQLLGEYKLSYQLLNAKPENVRRESEMLLKQVKKVAYCHKYGGSWN